MRLSFPLLLVLTSVTAFGDGIADTRQWWDSEEVRRVFASDEMLPTHIFPMRFRDTETGYAVQATVTLTRIDPSAESLDAARQGPPVTVESDPQGRLPLELPGGWYVYESSAPGYRGGRSYVRIKPGEEPLPRTVMMTPDTPPDAQPKEAPQVLPHHSLLEGYIVDEDTGSPLPNVTVRTVRTQGEATTDAAGHFSFQVPTSPLLNEASDLPDTDDIIATKPGYKTHIIRNMFLFEGGGSSEIKGAINMELQRGSGVTEEDLTHKLLRSGPDQVQAPHPAQDPALPQFKLPPAIREWRFPQQPGRSLPETQSSAAFLQLQTATLPTLIIVGRNCPTKFTCKRTKEYDLEDYVQRGLDDEWIDSWHMEAQHPLTEKYAICDTPACQTFDRHIPRDGRSPQAATDTAGIFLTKDGTTSFLPILAT